MKMNFLFVAAVAMFVMGCQKGDIDQPEEGSKTGFESYFERNDVQYRKISENYYTIQDILDNYSDKLVQSENSIIAKYEHIGLEQFVANLLKNKTGSENPLQLEFTKYVLEYKSVDTKGNPVYLSGALCVKKDASEFSELVIISHGTICSNDEAPSVNGFWPYGLLAVQDGIIALSCDYLGYGSSKDKPHPYLNQELTARNQLDFTKAALEFLTEDLGCRIDDSFRTYAVGASQGGSSALAVHRAIERETDFEKAINFRGSYCCEGPYNMLSTFDFYKDYGKLDMPVAILLVVDGMFTSYPDLFKGFSREDYLAVSLRGKGLFEKLESKQYNSSQMSKFMTDAAGGRKVSDILSEDALNSSSEIIKPLYSAFAQNNLADGSWYPRNACVFHHSTNDKVVPYSNLESVEEAFPVGSYIVSNLPLNLDDHSDECVYYYFTFTMDKWRVDEEF